MVKSILGLVRTDIEDKNYLIKFNDFEKIAKAAGYETLGKVIQINPKINSAYVFGRGKIEEIRKLIKSSNAEAFLVYNTLNNIQKINLEDYLTVKVVDRYDLILEIFEKNSGDSISKLQIELARLERMIPYVKKRAAIRYFRDRPGPRSLGEYAYHKAVAQLVSRKKKIKEKLKKYHLFKTLQIEKRKELGIPMVTLCGFYGAGKTTLFNALTKLNKEVKGIPFTTLSSKYSMVNFKNNKLLLVDTIGFAFDIDPLIIRSFEVTLEDIKNANLNVLIIDSSDEKEVIKEKLRANIEILNRLGVKNEKIIPVLNKVDLIDKNDLIEKIKLLNEYFVNKPIYISAQTNYNLDKLVENIIEIDK